jgi:hypothetical protein
MIASIYTELCAYVNLKFFSFTVYGTLTSLTCSRCIKLTVHRMVSQSTAPEMHGVHIIQLLKQPISRPQSLPNIHRTVLPNFLELLFYSTYTEIITKGNDSGFFIMHYQWPQYFFLMICCVHFITYHTCAGLFLYAKILCFSDAMVNPMHWKPYNYVSKLKNSTETIFGPSASMT